MKNPLVSGCLLGIQLKADISSHQDVIYHSQLMVDSSLDQLFGRFCWLNCSSDVATRMRLDFKPTTNGVAFDEPFSCLPFWRGIWKCGCDAHDAGCCSFAECYRRSTGRAITSGVSLLDDINYRVLCFKYFGLSFVSFSARKIPCSRWWAPLKNLQAPYGHGRYPLLLVYEVLANFALHVVTNEKLRSMVNCQGFFPQVFQMKGYARTLLRAMPPIQLAEDSDFWWIQGGHRESPN